MKRLLVRGTSGFSLIEVLVAMGAIAVGLLALMAVFITGTRSNLHAEELSRATYYARKITETVRLNGLLFAQVPFPPDANSGLNDGANVWRPVDFTTPLTLNFSSIRMSQLDANGLPMVDGMGNRVLEPTDVKFQRNIQTRRASTTPTAYNYNVFVMDVTVRWQGGKAGDGMRRTKVTSYLKRGG